MRRREVITLLGGAAAAWPFGARAEVASKRPLIAWLSGGTAQFSAGFVDNFLRGMRDLGYVESRNFDMVYRFADGYGDRLPALTGEVVRLKPDVILASAIIAAFAARKATSTIPIVSPALADAVHLGLIASEARPGGNVTGIEPYVEGLPAKQIEFAREIVPGVGTIGLLTNSTDPKAPPQAQELESLARTVGGKAVSADANVPEDINGALQALAGQRVDSEQQSKHRHGGIGETAADRLRISRARPGWRTDQLWGRFALVFLSRRLLCGQNSARSCAG
jgi:putative ABC transport system substrate-binding protein